MRIEIPLKLPCVVLEIHHPTKLICGTSHVTSFARSPKRLIVLPHPTEKVFQRLSAVESRAFDCLENVRLLASGFESVQMFKRIIKRLQLPRSSWKSDLDPPVSWRQFLMSSIRLPTAMKSPTEKPKDIVWFAYFLRDGAGEDWRKWLTESISRLERLDYLLFATRLRLNRSWVCQEKDGVENSHCEMSEISLRSGFVVAWSREGLVVVYSGCCIKYVPHKHRFLKENIRLGLAYKLHLCQIHNYTTSAPIVLRSQPQDRTSGWTRIQRDTARRIFRENGCHVNRSSHYPWHQSPARVDPMSSDSLNLSAAFRVLWLQIIEEILDKNILWYC
jgi:hypothetical protein